MPSCEIVYPQILTTISSQGIKLNYFVTGDIWIRCDSLRIAIYKWTKINKNSNKCDIQGQAYYAIISMTFVLLYYNIHIQWTSNSTLIIAR